MTTLDPRALMSALRYARASILSGTGTTTAVAKIDEALAALSQPQAGEPAAWAFRNNADDLFQLTFEEPDVCYEKRPLYSAPQPALAVMTDALVEHMVGRFLQWKLPENFNPDGGISFNKVSNAGTSFEYRHEPVGTNLFDFGHATEMVRHMLEGLHAPAAVMGAGRQEVANIVPEGCTGKALVFDPGALHVNKDGSGYFVVDEGEWTLEDDRCEGPDGPQGSVHWIARLDASEMQALRDFLNGSALSVAPATADGWRMVPEEATVEMVAAFWRQKNTGTQEIGGMPGSAMSDFDAYRAMIAAAPTATGGR